MRKHSARKWLHAVLDLLPVVLIPIFMIYSHRHDVSSTSTYTEEVPVYYDSNDVESVDDLNVGCYYTFDTSLYVNNNTSQILFFDEFYIVSGNPLDNGTSSSYGVTPYIRNGGSNFNVLLLATSESDTPNYDNTLSINNNVVIDFLYKRSTNLSSFVDCISFCPREYFKEYSQITYTFDKDIMGAFMSNFNFTIDKYFNMGNVFNLNGVYDWFNTNIFNGNAPQIIFSVWNIALYELVMDLLFLLYGLFMWFIDMCQKLMEKPLDSIK